MNLLDHTLDELVGSGSRNRRKNNRKRRWDYDDQHSVRSERNSKKHRSDGYYQPKHRSRHEQPYPKNHHYHHHPSDSHSHSRSRSRNHGQSYSQSRSYNRSRHRRSRSRSRSRNRSDYRRDNYREHDNRSSNYRHRSISCKHESGSPVIDSNGNKKKNPKPRPLFIVSTKLGRLPIPPQVNSPGIQSKDQTKTEPKSEPVIAKKDPKYGYATLMMRGDYYLPGALILAHSLRLVNSQYALIVMVTEDVTERARQALQLLYDYVIEVPYIKYTGKCKQMKTQKQEDKYKEWASDSFTKWNILKLTDFDKLIFLDSDKIVIQNIDHLFTDESLRCPAGTFSSPWCTSNGQAERGLKNYYPKDMKHGDEVPSIAIYRALYKNGFVAVGTGMLLEPNMDDYNKFVQMLDSKWISDEYLFNDIEKEKLRDSNEDDIKELLLQNEDRMIGFKNCYSMLDEQSIVYFYFYHQKAWQYIHPKYNFIPWHFKWLEDNGGLMETPMVLHFFGMKPWVLSPLQWRDLQAWWALVYQLLNHAATNQYKWTPDQQTLISSFFDVALMNELPFGSERAKDGKPNSQITCFWCWELARRQGLEPLKRIYEERLSTIDWIFHFPVDPQHGSLCCPRLKGSDVLRLN